MGHINMCKAIRPLINDTAQLLTSFSNVDAEGNLVRGYVVGDQLRVHNQHKRTNKTPDSNSAEFVEDIRTIYLSRPPKADISQYYEYQYFKVSTGDYRITNWEFRSRERKYSLTGILDTKGVTVL